MNYKLNDYPQSPKIVKTKHVWIEKYNLQLLDTRRLTHIRSTRGGLHKRVNTLDHTA